MLNGRSSRAPNYRMVCIRSCLTCFNVITQKFALFCDVHSEYVSEHGICDDYIVLLSMRGLYPKRHVNSKKLL